MKMNTVKKTVVETAIVEKVSADMFSGEMTTMAQSFSAPEIKLGAADMISGQATVMAQSFSAP
ncbi:hypothetical protein EGN72_15265 [Pseudorhodobacter sp. E13]|uniref:hypothetical protein n=1 Tax=Pseudorhodobacter sp. E13 TaxID=2487931 RepID=UPI000F8DF9FB|nr:hypothetical protein [Pseudorhodobacter sp. E13]RUS59296.1 hypothetical protein EGN72_15265 [Pseudorhodobacter sp. E13]